MATLRRACATCGIARTECIGRATRRFGKWWLGAPTEREPGTESCTKRGANTARAWRATRRRK
jgi:hypothetical protein